MDLASVFETLWEWAWARHHNILSWYIRPLFLLPFCWFSYRRSVGGILLTLVALATSMAWFPAPSSPSPAVIELLAQERAYLAGPWTAWKVLIALMVPALLFTLAAVFWQRSLVWGLVLINLIALAKITWTFVFAPGAGAYALLVPALAGLVVCNAAILLAAAHLRRRRLSTVGAGNREVTSRP